MRKYAATVFFAFVLSLGFVSAAKAGDMGIPKEVLAEYAKEKPLTQADFDEYIKLMPAMMENEGDLDDLAKVLSGSNLTPTRISLIGLKLGIGVPMMQAGPDALKQLGELPEVIRPTEGDMELIKNNFAEIMKVTFAIMEKQGVNVNE